MKKTSLIKHKKLLEKLNCSVAKYNMNELFGEGSYNQVVLKRRTTGHAINTNKAIYFLRWLAKQILEARLSTKVQQTANSLAYVHILSIFFC